MASSFKVYLFLLFVSLWQVSLRAGTCPAACVCAANVTLCRTCSYEVSLKDDLKIFQVPVCCGEDRVFRDWLQSRINRTLTQVVVNLTSRCAEEFFIFGSPLLDTRSLRIVNTSFVSISVDTVSKSLQELELSSNRLRQIKRGTFNKFTNLRELILCRNEITTISEDSFEGLSRLESLDLSQNRLSSVAAAFAPLTALQRLNVSGNAVRALGGGQLANAALQQLDVSRNALRRLAPGALQRLPNLAALLLADNPALGGARLVGSGRRLQHVDASRTGLAAVPQPFTHSVRFLALAGNRIAAVARGDLDGYPLLQSLDLAYNRVASIEEDALGRLEMLLLLNLDGNRLPAVPRSLPEELKFLSINDNRLTNLTRADFGDLLNLRILMLKGNRIAYIEEGALEGLGALELLDLSDNPLQRLGRGALDGPRALRDLRLCALAQLAAADEPFPLSAPDALRLLHLRASPALARSLLADAATLVALRRLQYLDLRDTGLSTLRADLPFYLAQLRTLRLGGNVLACDAPWLRDWLPRQGARPSAAADRCELASEDAAPDEPRYDGSFPRSFTIHESLPPVDLYSAELISELLRSYGYSTNDTGRPFAEITNKTYARRTDQSTALFDKSRKYDESNRIDNQIWMSDYSNRSSNVKVRESSKVYDNNGLQDDQLSKAQRFPNIELPLSPTVLVNDAKDGRAVRQRNQSGKRLNTPTNNTTVAATSPATTHLLDSTSESTRNVQRAQFSRMEEASGAATARGGRAAGAVVAAVLLLIGALLWRRRRRRRAPATPAPDQMEVASISGTVLW